MFMKLLASVSTYLSDFGVSSIQAQSAQGSFAWWHEPLVIQEKGNFLLLWALAGSRRE